MAASKQTYLSRIYNDFKNYPYGFRRSGDFSIKESEALEKYGLWFDALDKGLIEAEDDEDRRTIAVLKGIEAPESPAETAWVKYIKRINRPKMGSVYGTSKIQADDDSADPLEDDDIGDDIDVADDE